MKRMYKHTSHWMGTLLITIATIALTACSGSDSKTAAAKLKAIVGQISKELPTQIDEQTHFVSIELGDSTVVMKFDTTLPLDLSTLEENTGLLKESFAANMCLGDKQQKELFQTAANSNTNIQVELAQPQQKPCVLFFTPDELTDMLGTDADEQKLAYTYLATQAKLTDMQTPMQADEVTTLTKVSMDDKLFVYSYVVDEQVVDLDQLAENQEEMRNNLRTALLSSPISNMLYQRCQQAGVSLVYQYTGNESGKTVAIEF